MADDQYSEITIDVFLGMNGELPFDVYIRLGDNRIMQIFRKGDMIDPARFRSYQEKGVSALFINRKDRREYIHATERLVQKILAKGEPLSQKDASQALEEMTEQTLHEIYEDSVFDETSFRRAQEIAKNYVGLLKTSVSTLTSFINLSRNETYMCRHSIATSVISILIAKADNNLNDRTLNIIGLGGLLHDVGMVKIRKELWDVDRRLTAEEYAEIKRHPSFGSQIVSGIKDFPEEILKVVEQHHENWDGSGYPNGIKAEEIFYPARVVAIADSFSALTTRRGGRSLYRPDDALAILMTEKHKYDPKLLAAFEKLLIPQKKKAA